MERQPSKLELIRQMVAKSGTWQRASNRWSGTGARREDDGKRAEHGPGWRSTKSQPGVPHRRGAESAFVAVAFFLSTSNSHFSSSRWCAFLSPSSYLERGRERRVCVGVPWHTKHVRALQFEYGERTRCCALVNAASWRRRRRTIARHLPTTIESAAPPDLVRAALRLPVV